MKGTSMRRHRPATISLETQLGLLAMRFRCARDATERDEAATAYGHVVDQLIASGKWEEMPSFEDTLPDERMPEAFFTFWSIPAPRDPHGRNGKARKEKGMS